MENCLLHLFPSICLAFNIFHKTASADVEFERSSFLFSLSSFWLYKGLYFLVFMLSITPQSFTDSSPTEEQFLL